MNPLIKEAPAEANEKKDASKPPLHNIQNSIQLPGGNNRLLEVLRLKVSDSVTTKKEEIMKRMREEKDPNKKLNAFQDLVDDEFLSKRRLVMTAAKKNINRLVLK